MSKFMLIIKRSKSEPSYDVPKLLAADFKNRNHLQVDCLCDSFLAYHFHFLEVKLGRGHLAPFPLHVCLI